MKKTKIKFLFFFVLLAMCTFTGVYAQTGEGSTDAGAEPPPAAPISDAIPYLVVLGIGYACSMLSKNNLKEI